MSDEGFRKVLTLEDSSGQVLRLESFELLHCFQDLKTQHGARARSYVKELDILMVGVGETPNIISVPAVIPAGAYDVRLVGTVVEEVSGELTEPGEEEEDPPVVTALSEFDVGVSGADDISSDRFGTIDVDAGTEFGPADQPDSIQPTMYKTLTALTFTANDLVPFEAGLVRIAVFYTLATSPLAS